MDTGSLNTRAARAFVRGLAEAGVRHACITPGSRSTPLTVAFAEQTAIRPWLHLDERSSAFFALGLARATGFPVALVCTSGTAAANFAPAVAEANLSRVPLVVCTADRPANLRNVGAAQTIDQVNMFGTNARWSQDLPLPSPDAADPARFAAFAERAVRTALGALPGPVHLNLPFEEPLLAVAAAHPPAESWAPAREPLEPVRQAPAATEIRAAAQALRAAHRPLIVAGPETGGLPGDAVAALAAALGAPVLADPLSGLRTGAHDRSHILDSYDAVIRDARVESLAPDAVVRLGAIPTSKAANQFLERHHEATHVLLDLPGSWRDPMALTTHAIAADPGLAVRAITAALPPPVVEPGWLDRWLSADCRARDAMAAACARFDAPFEGRVFTELQALLPAGATVVVGNSMPVRDADAFVFGSDKRLEFVCNRGANGIDGVVSSALGAAAAGNGPVTLVIGDISFYHDMNGLWAAKRHNLDLTVVLVNNDGGGIFHYLPQSAHESVFEEWFGTPPGLDFRHAVALYGGTYTCAGDWAEFRAAVTAGHGLNVVEVRTERDANVAMHREAWAEAATAAWSEAAIAP